MHSALAIALLTLVVGLPKSASAAAPVVATPTINVQSFEYAPARSDGLMVRSALPQGHARWLLGTSLHYARRTVVFANRSGPVDQVQTILGDLWMMDLGLAVGWRKWTFEATLPVALVMRGGGPNLVSIERPMAPAFGDLRLGARRHLWRDDLEDMGQVDLSAMVLWAAPTGAENSWLTNGGMRLDALGLATWRNAGWQADMAAGLRLRPLSRLQSPLGDPQTGLVKTNAAGNAVMETVLAVGSEWLVQVGGGRRVLSDRLGVRLEFQFKGALASAATSGQTLADVLAQVDWRLARGAWRVFAAVGGGLGTSYGSAQSRLMVGVRFDPSLLPSDVDGDGLDDRDDRCPQQAEDKDGFEDDDGCPDLDNDGDGVPDTVDRCPLVPEDLDGRDDADGCPDLDDDGDGIPDSQDRCPTKAEDVDGFEDDDGCPDVDNDGDGMPDVDDLCPNAPESDNGYRSADGCPDVKPPTAVRDEGARLRLDGKITFAYGSAKLDLRGLKVLDVLAAYLRAHKALLALKIAVFTDNNGDAQALRALSQARAKAVKAYLIRRAGLQGHQVRAVGKGAAEPIADNATLAGRSRNRRVEIRILKRAGAAPQPH